MTMPCRLAGTAELGCAAALEWLVRALWGVGTAVGPPLPAHALSTAMATAAVVGQSHLVISINSHPLTMRDRLDAGVISRQPTAGFTFTTTVQTSFRGPNKRWPLPAAKAPRIAVCPDLPSAAAGLRA